MELRDYQKKSADIIVSYLNSEKIPSPKICVYPTASGKSYIIAETAKNLEGRTIVLQPSKELLEQNIGKFKALGGEASIYSASFKKKEISEVTYATIGSIIKEAKNIKDLNFSNLIIDEADRYSRSKDGLLQKFITASGIKKVIGLTATPFKLTTISDRFDYRNNYSILKMLTKRGTGGKFYSDILDIIQIKEIVDKKYWAKLEYDVRQTDTSKLYFNTTGADYNAHSLRDFYFINDIENKIIDDVKNNNFTSCIIFVPNIEIAERLSVLIPESKYVHSLMPDRERTKIIQEYRDKIIRVIINVNILSVGFDHPEIDLLINARPTPSLAWIYQAFGRGTRIHPNKEKCKIIDYGNNIIKFGELEHLFFEKIKGEWYLFDKNENLLTDLDLKKVGTKKKIHLL
jgi:DNA repair protein RadD